MYLLFSRNSFRSTVFFSLFEGDGGYDSLSVWYRRNYFRFGDKLLDHEEGDEAELGGQVSDEGHGYDEWSLVHTREVITRHVRNKGDYFTVENLFGETDVINSCSNNEGKSQENGKKSRKKKLVWFQFEVYFISFSQREITM